MIEYLIRFLYLVLKVFRKLTYIFNPGLRPQSIFQSGFQEILQGIKLCAVDVGGAVDLQPHWYKLIGSTHFHIFEPHPESYNEMVKKYGVNPFAELFHVYPDALSGKGGTRTLLMTNTPTGSTILKFNERNPYFQETNPYFFPMKKMELPTKTLDEVLIEKSVQNIDLIKLDIQGAELEVLLSMGKERLGSLLGFEMEVNLQDLYLDGTSLSSVSAFVENQGFEFFDFRVARGFVQRNGKTDFSKKYFDVESWSPSVSAKAWEFDIICFRKPDQIINEKDKETIKKLIVLYCVYNFFFDALELAEEALRKSILSQSDFDTIRLHIMKMKKCMEFELGPYSKITKGQGGLNWGQYMWLKYPTT